MGKRAVLYRRVSSDEQAKNGTGLDYQQRVCREYAARMGFAIVDEIEDAGITGKTPVAERPGGARLWQLVANHAVDVVVATRSHRVSRDEYGIELPVFYRHCDQNGVKLHLVDEGGEIAPGMVGKIILSLNNIKDGEDRLEIARRSRNGRLERARQGRLVLNGHIPYGYRKVVTLVGDKRAFNLVIDPEQAEMIREIYRLYTEERLGIMTIAKRLNVQGIAAPRANKKPRPGLDRNSLWYATTLRRLIATPRHIGVFEYGGVQIDCPDLALIDRATFDFAQRLLATSKQNSPRRTSHEYLLRSRMYCECGGRLAGGVSLKKYPYYRCVRKFDEGESCTYNFHASGNYRDKVVWEKLLEILSNRELLKRAARDYLNEQTSKLAPRRERLTQLEEERAEADQLAGESVKLAARAGVSSLLVAKYEQEAEKQLSRAARLDREIAEIKAELAHAARFSETEIDGMVDNLERRMERGQPTFAQKRALIEWANLTGQVEGERIKFRIEIGLEFSVSRSTNKTAARKATSTCTSASRATVARPGQTWSLMFQAHRRTVPPTAAAGLFSAQQLP